MAGFTNRQSLNGISYKVYVPDNCNANTNVLVYCHGGGDYDANFPTSYLNQYGSNTVIIFPTADVDYMETTKYGAGVVNIVNNVKGQLNITNDNLSVAGFSWGSTPAYTTMGEYLKQNPNCGSQTLFLLDNYPKGAGADKFNQLLQQYGSYYKNNNTMFVSMFPQYGGNGTLIYGSKQSELDCLARYGLNVCILHSYKASHPAVYNLGSDAGAHGCLEQTFWVDGFFNMLGDKSLEMNPKEYNLTIFNKSTGRYETTDFSSLNSLDKLRQYFGINIVNSNSNSSSPTAVLLDNGSNFLGDEILKLSSLKLFETSSDVVKSDRDVLLSNVNNVISDIKNTAFVSNGLNLSYGGSSTTKVPSGIPNIIGLYFTFSTNLLTEFSNFMNTVGNAGESIFNLDTTKKEESESLNDSVQLKTDTNTFNSFNNNLTSTNTGNVVSTGGDTTTFTYTPNNGGNISSYSVSVNNNNSSNSNTNDNGNKNYSNSYSNNNGGYSNSGSGSNSYSKPVQAIPNDTRGEVTTVVRNDNVQAVPNDTREEVTTVVRNDGISKPNTETVTAPPTTNNQPTNSGEVITNTNPTNINNTQTKPPIVIDSVITNTTNNSGSLPDTKLPVNSGNEFINNPDLDNVLNNNEVISVPVNNTSSEVVSDNSLSTLEKVGLAVGTVGALGVATGLVASKAFGNKKNEADDNSDSLSNKDKNDLSQYKDDYYEEV